MPAMALMRALEQVLELQTAQLPSPFSDVVRQPRQLLLLLEGIAMPRQELQVQALEDLALVAEVLEPEHDAHGEEAAVAAADQEYLVPWADLSNDLARSLAAAVHTVVVLRTSNDDMTVVGKTSSLAGVAWLRRRSSELGLHPLVASVDS